MMEQYQDAMAIVRSKGKPDVFITFTCDPGWQEIQDNLERGESAKDRADLTARVFRMKLDELIYDLTVREVLSKTIADVHVVEFQKRGLPHAHILLIFAPEDKIRTVDNYDSIISAEIPDINTYPRLHALVMKNMVHGPCDDASHAAKSQSCRTSAQSRHGECRHAYPKDFCDTTTASDDSYPVYRRTNNSPGAEKVLREATANTARQSIFITNQWIVPYNPWLLLKYGSHLNVEICSTVSSVKYLYKYVYKGHDRVMIRLQR